MERSEHRPRLSDIAEEEILYRIRSGELAVGSRLPSEPDLAQQMGISRGILREALTALQTRGYITRTPRGGSHIAMPDESAMSNSLAHNLMQASLADLMEIREAVELHAVRALALRVTEADLARLNELALFDEEYSVYSCRDFHYHLVEMSGIRLLPQYIDFYFDRFRALADPALMSVKRKNLDQDYARILDALAHHNVRAAVTAMRRYFRNERKHYQL